MMDNERRFLANVRLVVFVVVLLAGLPVWYYTTKPQRAPLPYEEIDQLLARRVAPVVPITVYGLGAAQLSLLLGQNPQLAGHVHVTSNNDPLEIREYKSVRDLLNTHNQNESQEELAVVGLPTQFCGDEENFHRQGNAIGICNGDKEIEKVAKYISESCLGNLPPAQDSFVVPNTGEYLVVISLLLDPSRSDLSWDIHAALDDMRDLTARQMGPLGKFTFETQILRYTNLPVPSKSDSSLDGSYFDEEDLANFLSMDGLNLGSTGDVPDVPTINFVVYASDDKVYFHSSKDDTKFSQSFLIPRWGGFASLYLPKDTPGITDQDGETSTNITAQADTPRIISSRDAKGVLDEFHGQLELLMGYSMKTSSNIGNSPWETAGVKRRAIVSNVKSVQQSLSSLLRLLGSIEEIVINNEVAGEVAKSAKLLEAALQHSSAGNINDALAIAQQAHRASERAFYHPSMLALLYFPADERYAVYMPLFLPVLLVLLLGLVKDIRQRKDMKKEN